MIDDGIIDATAAPDKVQNKIRAEAMAAGLPAGRDYARDRKAYEDLRKKMEEKYHLSHGLLGESISRFLGKKGEAAREDKEQWDKTWGARDKSSGELYDKLKGVMDKHGARTDDLEDHRQRNNLDFRYDMMDRLNEMNKKAPEIPLPSGKTPDHRSRTPD
jgi:hypothetical protein